MPQICTNSGSAARDFAMLERNLLSHLRLATLIFLLTTSLLLDARLPSPSEPSGGTPRSAASVPIASVELVAALTAIGAGIWEYRRGCQDMQDMKGFLVAAKPHFCAMAAVGVVVFATCVVLISDKSM
ncbi:hypothetical protein PHLGIDRAFT_77625 [Phlebiopsis gigantea 11061_1 CR5-6]|uniref:DUF202 domain-containing protein n=1 Tax=Phlebiopsis gigantea (strain 11061_1 CR5-6) TaxID=745531 RepID=A0A0C3NFE3_PHLG1|nr:hypothetical protein PHLGIDRAFT_77625 [Phlebiopsis gigantea 11061_1 CR5-6]